jgi:hypothetical protein
VIPGAGLRAPFLDLLEDVARYDDAWTLARETPAPEAKIGDADEAEPDEGIQPADEPGREHEVGSAGEGAEEHPRWLRALDLALAAGYVLRAKADGWKLFCERLSMPHFLFWEMHPGFDRLQRALKLADTAAFTAEGFLHRPNRIRPWGAAEMTELPLTVEGVADGYAKQFRARVEWWGG